ncbi:hypothetical protein E5288_WYG005835 [Bos mutus]|uniref:Uncharacterized protein n=1 Tax=Bos mutus TaxID=72004 RepID=A0A6B0QXE1_9CETA|nr:hypothetical protein [Bos mutus]
MLANPLPVSGAWWKGDRDGNGFREQFLEKFVSPGVPTDRTYEVSVETPGQRNKASVPSWTHRKGRKDKNRILDFKVLLSVLPPYVMSAVFSLFHKAVLSSQLVILEAASRNLTDPPLTVSGLPVPRPVPQVIERKHLSR